MIRITGINSFPVVVPTKNGIFPRRLGFGILPALLRTFTVITAEVDGAPLRGYAETCPTFPYTIETPAAAAELTETVGHTLLGKEIESGSPEDIRYSLEAILSGFDMLLRRGLNIVHAGIDYALLDLVGRTVDLPAWKILSPWRRLPSRGARCCWSLDADARNLNEEVLTYSKKGYALKIKLTGDVTRNIAITRRVLKSASQGIPVCADANATMDLEGAKRYLAAISSLPLGSRSFFLEEPLTKAHAGSLPELLRTSPCPIMLDESIYSRSDALLWIEKVERGDVPAASVALNLKPDKLGGLTETVKIMERLSHSGMRYMIGGMFPSSYGKLVNVHAAILADQDALLPSDGVHPSRDYVATPLITNLNEMEVVEKGIRRYLPFANIKGLGGEVDERLLQSCAVAPGSGAYRAAACQPLVCR